MPRKWQSHHWPLEPGQTQADRDRLIHTVGNLTLLTGKLNAKVSNGPWLGSESKRAGLQAHDVLMLNRKLVESAKDSWTEEMINIRSGQLADWIIEIWPAPPGHRSPIGGGHVAPHRKVQIADLISAGHLVSGQTLTPRRSKYGHIVGTVLPDGRIDIDGTVYETPSKAGSVITGKPTNGWYFFLVDKQARRSLRDVRRDYLESLAEPVEEEEDDDEDAVDEDSE
jgi:hypothetical protein